MNRIEEMESLANKICKAEAGQEPNETNLAFRKTLVHGMNMWNQHIGSNFWTSPCICPPDEKTGETLCCNHCGKPTARTSKELPGDDVKFEELLQAELDKLPYTKHVDDGQYNDGVLVGWELGSRWFYSIASPLLASRDARIRELEEALRSIEIGADPRSEYQAYSWIDTAREIANKALTPPKN